jgi:hypothetical protein
VGSSALPARAQPELESAAGPSLLLEWSGPGPELDCLGEDRLKHAVNDYLGRDAFEPPAELVVRVTLERLPARHFHARIEVADTAGHTLGTREITSSSELCSSLDERLTLALALIAEPAPEAPPAPPSRAETPVTTEPERDEVEAGPAVRHEPHRSARDALLATEAAAVVEGGLLPRARPGLRLGLRIQASPWLVMRAGGLAFLPASKDVAGASARFSVFAATAELCGGKLDASRFQAALCAGALYAGLAVAPHRLDGGHDRLRGLLAGSLGVHVAQPLSRRFSLVGEVAGVFPVRPERFVVQVNSEPEKLFQVSKPAFLASLGAAVTF